MENRTANTRPNSRSYKENRSRWKIGGLEGVIAEKLGLDGK